MENQEPQNQKIEMPKSSNLGMKVGAGVLAVIIFVAVVYFNKKSDNSAQTATNDNLNSSNNTTESPVVTDNTTPPTPVTGETPSPTTTPTTSTSVYKNGTYTATGNYTSPGGAEQIKVTLTIKDDVVVSSSVTALATRPASVNFQGQFVSGYKEFVDGKKIDSLSVSKVAGSSLTGKGFNDAVAQIKTQAKS